MTEEGWRGKNKNKQKQKDHQQQWWQICQWKAKVQMPPSMLIWHTGGILSPLISLCFIFLLWTYQFLLFCILEEENLLHFMWRNHYYSLDFSLCSELLDLVQYIIIACIALRELEPNKAVTCPPEALKLLFLPMGSPNLSGWWQMDHLCYLQMIFWVGFCHNWQTYMYCIFKSEFWLQVSCNINGKKNEDKIAIIIKNLFE